MTMFTEKYYGIRFHITNYLSDLFRGRRLRWFIQRRRRGFDERELWGLDNTIIDFALPRIKAFNKMDRQGVALCFYDEDKDSHTEEETEKAYQKAQEVFQSIEDAFTYMSLDGSDIDNGCDFELFSEGDGQTRLNIKKDEEKFKEYMKEMDRREEVIKHGLNNFATYFRTLWD